MHRSHVAALLTCIATTPLAAQNADWRSYNGALDGTRYSTLDRINTDNASQLERVCTFDGY